MFYIMKTGLGGRRFFHCEEGSSFYIIDAMSFDSYQDALDYLEEVALKEPVIIDRQEAWDITNKRLTHRSKLSRREGG